MFFPHDYHARLELIAIQRYFGMAGIGVYWCIVELMHEKGGSVSEDDLDNLAFELHTDAELVREVANCGVFYKDGHDYKCRRVEENLQKLDEMHERRSVAGKKGMASRWKAEPEPPPDPPERVRITQDAVKAYATFAGLRYVNTDRFWNYYGGRDFATEEEWHAELRKWNDQDKAKRAPLPKAGGSFDTDEFFGTAVRNSYKEAK